MRLEAVILETKKLKTMQVVNIERFSKWLTDNGCSILPSTNEYEKLRFKGQEVGVIYSTWKTNSDYATNAIIAFNGNKKWNGGAIKTGRCSDYKKQKKQLIIRDGSCCFYCGKELEEDMTVEHLLSLRCGGKNDLSNMVLAHQKCNQDAGNLSVVEKVKIAIANRF